MARVAQRLLVSLMLAAGVMAAAAAAFPGKPVRLVVPFPPGGALDTAARLIAAKLHDNWRQPVIVENRAGANTVNAVAAGLNSKIQTVKKAACGFRSFENFKTAIFFQRGGLRLYPVTHGKPG